MADASAVDPITLWEALKFLGPLVGTGGVTAIVVAYLGSRRPAAPSDTGDGAHKAASLGIQALLADHLMMDRMVNELRRLADVGEDMVRVGNRICDLMDIVGAIERLQKVAAHERQHKRSDDE